ncbi:hypothetical protein OIU85_010958 [Salix viminalis]|uniref:NTP pyrophosphohydrolase MazG-like domain-containing protein n=1 Tax=Salix viminalis TaxID=40686 RepID=A0A9Q0NRS4_SALVM|nr:hypothetical protein OIU85_010958 [Salix viminalis]
MAGDGVTLEDLKKRLAEFAEERDWDQFHSPRNLLLAMVGEVGELSEIFQWKGEVPRGLPNWKDEEKQHLGEELSDVLLYLVRLSDICGVDLGKAALRKLKMNAIKYPANAGSRGSSEKRTEINSDVDNDAGGDCVTGRSIYSDSSTSNGAGSQGSSKSARNSILTSTTMPAVIELQGEAFIATAAPVIVWFD